MTSSVRGNNQEYRLVFFLGIVRMHPNQDTALQILIRNIDRKLTEEEIHNHVSKYGRVKSFDLVMDTKTGLSKGFGFAEMPEQNEALKAIQEMNGMKIGSSILRVKRAANSSLKKKG